MKYTPLQPMAPEFTPISQKAVEPILRPARVLMRVDPGYAPRLVEERPTRVRASLPAPLPSEEEHTTSLDPRRCPDCAVEFQPRAWNHTRCAICAALHRKREGASRRTTSRTRKDGPRSLAWLRGQATRKVNEATRERARVSAAARRRSA